MLYPKASLLALLVGQANAASVAKMDDSLVALIDPSPTPAPVPFTHPMRSPDVCKADCQAIHPIHVYKTFGATNKPVILAALYHGCNVECTTGYVPPVGPPSCPTGDVECLYDDTSCDSYCGEIDLYGIKKYFDKASGEKHAIYTAMKSACKHACANIPKTPATLSYPLGDRTPLEIQLDCSHITPIGVHSAFGDDKPAIMTAMRTGCEEAATAPYNSKAAIVPNCTVACKYSEDECDSHCGEIDIHGILKWWSGDGEKSEIYHASKHACRKKCANIEDHVVDGGN